MTIILVFLAVVGSIAAWWLSSQRIMSKPWLETGVIEEAPRRRAPPAAKIGLGVFIAVAGALFALTISAYSMRLEANDWWPLPVPRLLWLNTFLLVLASATLEWARVCVRRADIDGVRFALVAALTVTLAFLVGQLLVWRELNAAGYFLAANPANAFFYLVTGLHGLHVLGGLAALGRVAFRALRARRIAPEIARVRLGVELCAIYWHFLLFVWLVLFALIAGWAGDFLEICRQALS